MPTLTPREQEVLGLLGEGLAAKEIAKKLCIDRKTVDTFCGHLREKLEITSMHELIVFAVKNIQYQDNDDRQAIDWCI